MRLSRGGYIWLICIEVYLVDEISAKSNNLFNNNSHEHPRWPFGLRSWNANKLSNVQKTTSLTWKGLTDWSVLARSWWHMQTLQPMLLTNGDELELIHEMLMMHSSSNVYSWWLKIRTRKIQPIRCPGHRQSYVGPRDNFSESKWPYTEIFIESTL